ncbi:MAG: hypothetical protein E6R03_09365 [Hyphomicrobiaceae bacterium]|nr:MAG: hypothetical protein E6R03_09365 [Hyphomicrobiaceae bacterium]
MKEANKKVVDASRFKMIKAEQLVKADWNYKENNEELTAKLVENIKRNGQIENILVRELETGFFEVVNGNHRVDALRHIEAPSVMCYDLGKITAEQAYRIAIETNETRFATDNVKLAGLIAELSKNTSAEDLLLTMPYTNDELQNFIGMASFDFKQYEEQGEQEHGADSGAGQPRLSFLATADIKVAWAEWQARCKKLHPKMDSDEAVFYQALAAALDHTEDFVPTEES